MKRGFYFTIGILLVIAALAGLVICVGGIYGVWQIRAVMVENLENTLGLLEDTIKATGNALNVADDSLGAATSSVDALATTIRTTGRSVKDTLPMIEALTKLTSEDLPTTIETTQEALYSAQSSAQVIDSTLGLLSTIPLLPLPTYDPQVPLGESLGSVAKSLDPLPDSLIGMKTSLELAQGNLSEVGGQFDTIANNVSKINASLTESKNVIAQYQGVVSTLEQQIAQTKASLPALVDIGAWVFTIVLVWLGLTQVGLMMQGFEMIGMGVVKEEKDKPTPPEASPSTSAG